MLSVKVVLMLFSILSQQQIINAIELSWSNSFQPYPENQVSWFCIFISKLTLLNNQILERRWVAESNFEIFFKTKNNSSIE